MKTQFFETGPLHADEGQEWTADTQVVELDSVI